MAQDAGSIIYLEKDKLFFYNGEKVLKLDFTPQVVRDFDILNEEAFISLIFQFIDSIKTDPSRFLMVLSESVIFTNDYKDKDLSKVDLEFQTFIDLVPYDRVLSKKYRQGDSIKMISTNADIVNVISDSFEQRGFVSDGVVPAMIFGQFGVKRGLDANTANFMLKNQQSVKGKTMGGVACPPEKVNVFKVTKGKNKMLPYLIGGFALAFIGLLVLILLRK